MMRTRALVCALMLLSGCESTTEPQPFVGTLEWQRHALSAQSAETVRAVHVREGQRVEAGQALLELDSDRAQARLQRAAALREQAEARLSELLRGPRPEAIDEAQATVRAREAELLHARIEVERVERLYANDAVSRSELDRAHAARDRLEAQRAESVSRLESLLEGTTLEELDQARAALRAADAAEIERRIDLQQLEIRSPVDGVVESLPYRRGERPALGATVAVVLAEDEVYARVYVPAPQRIDVRPGLPARIHVDGLAEPLSGRVRFVASESAFTPYFALTERDRARLSYLAEVLLDPLPDPPPPGGLPVEVVIGTSAD